MPGPIWKIIFLDGVKTSKNSQLKKSQNDMNAYRLPQITYAPFHKIKIIILICSVIHLWIGKIFLWLRQITFLRK